MDEKNSNENHLCPHDRYVRSVMSLPGVAQEFFKKHLPAEVINVIDFSSIALQKDSFINDKFRLKVADLLFSVNFNDDPGYVYLLLEHTSNPDRFLPYRMLEYILGIIDQHRTKAKNKKDFPLVLPLILYTGKKPYNHSTDLFDLFGKEKDLAKSVFLRPFELIDLNKISDEFLAEDYYLFGTAAITTKHIRDFDLVSFVKSMVHLLKRLKKEGLSQYVHTTLSYIFTAGDVKDEEGFRDIIRSGLSNDDEGDSYDISRKIPPKRHLRR